MRLNDDLRIDAVLLLGSDALAAWSTLGRLAVVSLDFPLRTIAVTGRREGRAAELVSERCPWVELVADGEDEGRRVEEAVARGHAELVLLLDAGARPTPETVRALVRYLDENADVDAVSWSELAGAEEGAAGAPLVLARRSVLAADGGLRHAAGARLGDDGVAWHLGLERRTQRKDELGECRRRFAREREAEALALRASRARRRCSPSLAENDAEELHGELIRRVRAALELPA